MNAIIEPNSVTYLTFMCIVRVLTLVGVAQTL